MTQAKPTVAGSVRDVAFLDTETCFWQLARQQFQQLKAYSASGFPHIGVPFLEKPFQKTHSRVLRLWRQLQGHTRTKQYRLSQDHYKMYTGCLQGQTAAHHVSAPLCMCPAHLEQHTEQSPAGVAGS